MTSGNPHFLQLSEGDIEMLSVRSPTWISVEITSSHLSYCTDRTSHSSTVTGYRIESNTHCLMDHT